MVALWVRRSELVERFNPIAAIYAVRGKGAEDGPFAKVSSLGTYKRLIDASEKGWVFVGCSDNDENLFRCRRKLREAGYDSIIA